MDDRNRAAPIALARDAPVAQLVIDLAAALGRAEQLRLLQPARRRFLGLRHGEPVEKARIDQPALAVMGRVGDLERRGIDAFRANHRRRAETVFVGEVEVALVMRRTAENRAGPVIHQHEIGDIDRQQPSVVEGVNDLEAGVEALFLRRLDRRDRRAHLVAFVDETPLARDCRRRCFARADGPPRRRRISRRTACRRAS